MSGNLTDADHREQARLMGRAMYAAASPIISQWMMFNGDVLNAGSTGLVDELLAAVPYLEHAPDTVRTMIGTKQPSEYALEGDAPWQAVAMSIYHIVHGYIFPDASADIPRTAANAPASGAPAAKYVPENSRTEGKTNHADAMREFSDGVFVHNEHVAKALGISRATLSNYLSGKTKRIYMSPEQVAYMVGQIDARLAHLQAARALYTAPAAGV